MLFCKIKNNVQDAIYDKIMCNNEKNTPRNVYSEVKHLRAK